MKLPDWIHKIQLADDYLVSKTLLTIGTVFGTMGLSLHEIHDWLSVILQVLGFISFAIHILINWDKIKDSLRKRAIGIRETFKPKKK
jgi:hypothetical protein